MSQEGKFWMVYAEGRQSPNKRHLTIESAEEEAERLARQNNSAVYVLESKFVFKVTTPPIEKFTTK